MVLLQSEADAINELAQAIFDDILSFSEKGVSALFWSVVVFSVAYSLLFAIQAIAHNISEKVPRRRRLFIKQLVPFLKGLIWVGAGICWLRIIASLTEAKLSGLAVTLLVGLGFAFKDYISSVVAGVINLVERPFRMGDRIQIGDHYGEVVDYGLRGLQLQTPDDNAVTIPHSATWTQPISNANSGQLEAQVVTTFYFAHDTNISLAVDILYQAAYSSRYTQLKNTVVVIISEERWATQLQLKSYPMDARNEFVYKTDLVLRVKEACARQNISYPRLPDPHAPIPLAEIN